MTGPTMPTPSHHGTPGAPFHPGGSWPPVPTKKKRRVWPWVIIGLVVLMFGGCMAIIGGAANEVGKSLASATSVPAAPAAPVASSPAPVASAPPATPPPAPKGPRSTFGEGTYKVGEDVVPGRYKTAGPDKSAVFPSCYWARLRNDSGEFAAIIANGNTEGPASVTVKAGEFLEARGTCAWTLAP